MATINRENIGVLNDRITVTVKEEDYNPGFQKMLKQYSKDATLPGFRKGKVPASLIKKMYGKSLFPQEVLKSVESGLNDYLKTEKLELFGQPILQENGNEPRVDMNRPDDYSFNFEVGIKPELALDDIEQKLHFVRYKVKPEEKDIDEEVKQLQLRAATFEDLEEVRDQEDDILTVTFQASDEKGDVSEEAETHEDKYRFSYFSAAMREQLKGKKKEDTLVIQLKDAFEAKELDWVINDWKLDKEKAPEDYYRVTLLKIEKTIPRELKEDFFQEVFPGNDITTEEDFRKKIAEQYQAQYDHQAKHLLEHEIFDKLVNEMEIELPVDFLKKQLKTEGGKPKTDEEVEKQYPEFEKQTRWGLITSEIINKANLEVTPDEVKAHLQRQILGYFQLSEVNEENEGMVSELTNRLMQEEGRVDEAYRTILTDKLFDWLIEKADIEEKEVNTEEFTKLQQEHNHEHHEHGSGV